MENNELLLAIRQIVKEEIQPIKDDVQTLKTDVNTLKAELQFVKDDLNSFKSTVDAKFEEVHQRLDEIKDDTEVTRMATNALVEWAETVGVVTRVEFPIKKVN